MWKATTKTVVMAVALVGLGTGCDLEAVLNQLADQITNPGDPGDPSIPENPDQVPGDPGDPGIPEGPPDGWEDCPPPHDPFFECELQLDDCLNSGVDQDFCFVDFDLCLDQGWPEPPPVDPNDPWFICEIELDECLGGIDYGQPVPVNDPTDPGVPEPWPIGEEEICFIQFDECLGWTEPPLPPPWSPCEELFDLCLSTGVEPGLCEEVHDQCLANGPGEPVDPTDPGDPAPPDDGNGDDDVVAY